MNQHNFILTVVDTDSLAFVKQDMSPFSKEEQDSLIQEINNFMPKKIQYAHDGYFKRCVAIRAKNYILYDGEKIKVKGSGLKGSTKSPAIKEFTQKVIDILAKIEDKELMYKTLQIVYKEYVNEIMNVNDIKRFSARKTLSSTMMESERTNETKVMEALKGSNYTEGDRFYTFYLSDDSLCLSENFTGDYNKVRLLKNLFDTVSIFDTVLPVKELFPNYSLKKNQKLLEQGNV